MIFLYKVMKAISIIFYTFCSYDLLIMDRLGKPAYSVRQRGIKIKLDTIKKTKICFITFIF